MPSGLSFWPPLPVSLADWPFCSIFSSRFRPKQFLPLTFCFLLAPCFLLSLTGDFLLAVRPLALTFSYRCIRFLFFFTIECFPFYQACPMASLFSPSGTVGSQYHPRMLLRGSNYNHLLLLAIIVSHGKVLIAHGRTSWYEHCYAMTHRTKLFCGPVKRLVTGN